MQLTDDLVPTNIQDLSLRHAVHPNRMHISGSEIPSAGCYPGASAIHLQRDSGSLQELRRLGYRPTARRDVRGEWWRVFNDPDLNALEDQLNINNQNIKEFFQNFMAARALIAETNAQLYPTLTANASWTKSRTPRLTRSRLSCPL